MKDEQRKAMFANIFKGSDKRKTQVAEFGKVKNFESGLKEIKKEKFSFQSFQESLPRPKVTKSEDKSHFLEKAKIRDQEMEVKRWKNRIENTKSQKEIEELFKKFKKKEVSRLSKQDEKKIKELFFKKARNFPDEDDESEEKFVPPKEAPIKITPQIPGIVGRTGKDNLLKDFGTTTQFHKDFEETMMELSSEVSMPPWDADKTMFEKLDNHFKNRFSVEDKKKLITLYKTYKDEGFTEKRIANMLNLALTGKGKALWQGKIKAFYDKIDVEGGMGTTEMPITEWADNYFEVDKGELH